MSNMMIFLLNKFDCDKWIINEELLKKVLIYFNDLINKYLEYE